MGFVWLGFPRCQFWEYQKKAINKRQENWGNFASFYWRFIQGFSKAKSLTSMLKTTITRSAENLLLDMAEDAWVDGNDDSGDNETVKRSPLSKKPNGPIGYFLSLRSYADNVPFGKRWVSFDSFGYGWSFQF